MEDDSNRNELVHRIARLEAKVHALEQQLAEKKSVADDSPVVNIESDKPSESALSGTDMDYSIPIKSKAGEDWLNRIGIGLLLLGVAFLFKYSVDQGWLVPPIRSTIGLGIGLGLFVAGIRMSEDRNPMRAILLGGGIAAFYITGFATFQLFNFVSHPIMWIFMILVTLLALSFSLQQNEPILSVIGTLGGLGTPFMLYTGSGSLTLLIGYTGIILAGTGYIYLYKGWKGLLWTMVFGGWLVLCVGIVNNIFDVTNPTLADRLALQTGLIITITAIWVLPVVREVLVAKDNRKWSDPGQTPGYNPSVQILSLLVPVGSFIYAMVLWNLDMETWGVISMASSLILGYTYLPLSSAGLKNLGSVHGFSALVLLTLSFFLLLEGNILFVILALEGLGLRYVSHNIDDDRVSAASHILFCITGLWLLHGLTDAPGPDPAVFNATALARLMVIGIIGSAVLWLRKESSRMVYLLGAHLALLGWFLFEMSALENGQAFVSVSWALYAIVLLVAGFAQREQWLRLAGMGTVFLVVGKLFLVDLSQLQAIWRILLFIGCGFLFLMIGYFIQTRFGEEQEEGREADGLI